MRKYYVIRRDTCPNCNGGGTIVHPLWRKLYGETLGEFMSHDELFRWFCDYGYDKPPREEVACGYCNGEGFVETKVPFDECVEELSDFLKKGDDDER